ncbi:MAG: protein-glutamate O-methyltransferase CheR [Thermoanaerobaculia bacterium]|jgi:chemotaxis protein methyltransferase CheR
MSIEIIERFARGVEGAMSDSELARFRDFVMQETGIRLNETKRALLVGRLSKRLRETKSATYGDYLSLVKRDGDERVRMLDLVTTNETSFFREPTQFEFLEQVAIPRWKREADEGKRERVIRVWSAACSSGEEPYSVAMLLAAQMEGFRIEILASDISTRVLDRARSGIWPIARAGDIPPAFLRRYMLRGIGKREGTFAASDDLKRMITFRRLNLIDEIDTAGGPFELVLCRNVMMYFDGETRRGVVDGLIDRCERGGYLLVGHAETLHGVSGRVESARPTIWVKRA